MRKVRLIGISQSVSTIIQIFYNVFYSISSGTVLQEMLWRAHEGKVFSLNWSTISDSRLSTLLFSCGPEGKVVSLTFSYSVCVFVNFRSLSIYVANFEQVCYDVIVIVSKLWSRACVIVFAPTPLFLCRSAGVVMLSISP